MHLVISLPLIGYAFLYLAFCLGGQGWRASALGAATIWGIIVVLITELLSIPRELTSSGIALAWLVADGTVLVYVWLVTRHKFEHRCLEDPQAAAYPMIPRQTLASALGLFGVGSIVVLVVLTAIWSPPNTWDALTYHLPRLVHWLQHRSVSPYPTFDVRQLHMPPWAEYAMLQVHALWGGDRLNGLVQWASMLGSIVGVTLVAQQLGAGTRGQMLAAVICATIPQGLLQASGAKNDYVVAFWLVAVTYYLLTLWREPTWPHTVLSGSALGLAWLTKGTAYIFSGPLLLMLGLAALWRPKPAVLKGLVVAIILATGINVVHFSRNYRLFASPFGPEHYGHARLKLTNDALTGSILASNILRNMALHLGTPIQNVNRTLEHWIQAMIHALGEDPNNPQSTWLGTTFRVPDVSRHEAVAGNPLHLALINLCLGLVLLHSWKRVRESKCVALYAVTLVATFLLFCAVLRWQPWHTRLHLPLFVLWSAPLGVCLTRAWSGTVTNSLGMLLVIVSLPFLLGNQLRPFIGGGEFNILRQERGILYFSESNHLQGAYRVVAAFIKRQECWDIGLDLPPDSPEYLLLALLEAHTGLGRVEHLDVRNPSRQYASREEEFRPCAIICLFCSTLTEKWKTHMASMEKATVIHQHVVFHSTGGLSRKDQIAGQPSDCALTFLNGWHAKESNGHDWWIWSDGHGKIQISTDREIDFVLSGAVSAVQQPDQVDFLVNGDIIVTWKIAWDGFRPFTLVGFRLTPGEHNLVFANRNPPIYLPTDPRPLAFGLADLRMISVDGTILCELHL